MKKTLALLLTMILLATMMPMALAEAAPTKIVMVCPYYGDPSSEAGYKMVQDYILEQTGVLVEAYRYDTNNNRVQQTNFLLSRGEQVDMWMDNYVEYKGYGQVQPITNYMEYIPHVVEMWEPYNGFKFVTDKDGEIWGIPRYVSMTFHMTFFRQDWLDLLGFEQPKTFDEMEKFLYAVKEADPYGNGETIPMITRSGDIDRLAYHFLGGFTKFGYANWIDETDGRLKPYYLQEGFYDFLVKMAQWYKDGIIHLENPSWNLATVRKMFAAGRVAVSGAYGTDLCNQYITMRQNVPGSSWWYDDQGMIGPNGEITETVISGDDQAVMINAKSSEEQLIACLKFIDWVYSDFDNIITVEKGIKGVHWDYDDSVENAKELKIVKMLPHATDIAYKSDFWACIGLCTESAPYISDPDGVQNMQNMMLRKQKELNYAKRPVDEGVIYDTSVRDENVPTAADINTMRKERMMAFFTGAEELTPEAWDAFIAELYDLGLDDYIDEYTRQYKEAKGL